MILDVGHLRELIKSYLYVSIITHMKRKGLILFYLLVAILGSNLIAVGQVITTMVGNGSSGYGGDNGQASAAMLKSPWGVATDRLGNIYVSDNLNNRIRKIDVSGVITTIAGTGTAGYNGDGIPATLAQLIVPHGVALDDSGNIYVADLYNIRVRKINSAGIISTIAGNGLSAYTGDGGDATAAQINSPYGICTDHSGNVYFADCNNSCIRMISTAGIINTVAGSGMGGFSGDGGVATNAQLSQPTDVTVDDAGNIYIADFGNNCVRKVVVGTGRIGTIAGNGTAAFGGDGGPATIAELQKPAGVVVDSLGNLYIADFSNFRIRKVNTLGVISTIAGTSVAGYNGDGASATSSQLNYPCDLAIDNTGGLLICDLYNNRIRTIKNLGSTEVIDLELGRPELSVYPNPSNGVFTIMVMSMADVPVQVVVYDMMGRVVGRQMAVSNHLVDLRIDQPTGVYFVSASIGDTQLVKQIELIREE